MPDEYDDLLDTVLPKKKADPNREALADPRVKTFLDKIGKSEGADYNTLVGGRKINDLSKHPNTVGLRTSAGPSTAFGKYQIVGTTDRSKLKKYSHLDYSPENQDVRAVELLRQTGSLDALQQGDETTAMRRAGREWASIPGSTLPGRKNTAAWRQKQRDAYDDLLDEVDPKVAPQSQQADPYDEVVDSVMSEKPQVGVSASAKRPRRSPAQDAVSQLMGATQQAKQIALRPRAPVGMGDVQQASRITGRDSAVNQTSDELRVMKGEQPVDRQGYSRQQDAQARLSRMQDESYREREVREAKDAEKRAALQPEIERQTKLYREDIQKAKQRGGDANKWISELGSKAAGQLAELAPGDTAQIHSEAALRAAEEEGADRSQLSKGIQNIGAGFIGSAPELAAMTMGLPAPLVFGAGSAIRSKSSDPLEVAKAAEHGVESGLAYEIPGVGKGITKALTGSAATGATTAALDLASGASPKEALISGATNALMRGVPEAIKLRPRSEGARQAEAQRQGIAAEQQVTGEVKGQPVVEAVTEHHSQRQPRSETGQFDGPPAKPAELGKEVVQPEPGAVSVGDAAPAIKLKERSFPKTVREAGYKAEDSTYEVLGNKETVAKANATIKEKGVDLAVAELGNRKEFTPEDVAVGSRAIQEYEKSGQMDKAIDTVETLATNLTKAGQTVQAASIIARLSPEGTLLYAQRQLPKGVKLKPEQGEKLVAQAKKVRQADLKIGTLNERIEQMQKEAKQPKAKVGTLADRLLKMETDARARLAERLEKAKMEAASAGAKGQRGAGVNPASIPLDIADYAIIGAAKLARKGVTLAEWSKDMVKEFGEDITPHMKAIYKDSYKLYDEQRKQFAQESTERSARKAEPNAKDIQAVINQRALARKDARTHKAELSRLFKDLSLTKFGKVKATAVDVISIPRSLKSSVDLSAPRQGAMWMINHPVQGAKLFFGKQLKAMREVNYDRYVDQLESDPDYPLMTRSELALPIADQRPNSLSGREEAFMSRLAGNIPLVSHSERAYSTFITTARVSWFKQLKAQAENKAKSEGKELSADEYKAIANFVNIGTGRGNLGKGTVNKMAPFLNAVFFAPKFAASKVQIFDPRVYARLPKGARKTAMREAATYFGAMTTAATLLKYGMGAQVGLNPEDSEFMKVRKGNTRYDLSNGTGQYVRLAASLLKNAENKATGKKDPFGKSIGDNVDRFTRYKYSPPTGFARNVWEGKNAIGEKTSAGRESLELITPLFLKDLYDAYKEEGLTGVAKTSPGFVGVGVNTYGDREKSPVKLHPRKGSAFKF